MKEKGRREEVKKGKRAKERMKERINLY